MQNASLTARLRRLTVELAAARAEAVRWRRLALRDSLTGLPNRREFETLLAHYFAVTRRAARPFSVVMFDLDGLKAINDGRGHDAGDRALRRMGRALKRAVRCSDVPARWGGDEFAVLLPDTPKAGAEALVARLAGHLGGLKVSAGCAEAGARDTPARLVARADRDLRAGRRRARRAGVRP